MLTLPPSVKIFLYTAPTDMRKGHDGLSALVVNELKEDVFSGHLFVFVSKRGDRVKILAWDRGGLALWYKRLEKGRFRLPNFSADSTSVSMDATELSMLLEGIDYSKVRRPKQWEPPRREGYLQ
ncbi:MAG: IS66 family insertion sequence element accessory protein TnpB [Proteobacteria bacterium]|nr:IS66 family insertion sequence element accessory protein TnpB [Pseudomonadota bacterium]